MSTYRDLELVTLMDLLIRHTVEYTKMVSYKVFSVEEFSHCKQNLAEIHSAIKEKISNEGKPTHNILPNYPENFDGVNCNPSSNQERSL